MLELGNKTGNATIMDLGIVDGIAHWNLTPDELIAYTLKWNQGTLDNNGALAIDTGEFTGRSPKDKFTVKDDVTSKAVWWNNFNIPFSTEKFDQRHFFYREI